MLNYLRSSLPPSLQEHTFGVLTTSTIGLISILYLLRKWLRGGQVPSSWLKQHDYLRNKTVVITGANTGIGLETSKILASLSANIIMGCRNLEKGRIAVEQVKEYAKQHGNVSDSSIEVLELDLSSMDSVREFARQVNDKTQQQGIDILINNAGVMMCPHGKTKDGFEMQFGTNHLGHFLLTNLLLDRIQQVKGRVVTVSSLAHYGGKIHWDSHKNDGSDYSRMALYAQSKIANVLFTYELNRRYGKGPNAIKAFSLHPGAVNTELPRHFPAPLRIAALPAFYFLFKTPMDGAQTTLYAALNEHLESGLFLYDCVPKKSDPVSYDEELSKELWEKSLEYTNLK